MIHTYTLFDRHIVIDVPSGAVHEVDGPTLDLLRSIKPPMSPIPPIELSDEEKEIWGELYSLQCEGLLFSEDTPVGLPTETPLKALCLHVAHDCNLRCEYCFASTGDFGTGRAIMSPETAERAIDYLLSRCGTRRNLEIDFFGGEPLMALDTVKHTVEYARNRAPEKNFRFTITTNGLLLDEDAIEYINREMNNVVLSLDGRREINDSVRRTAGGHGCYDVIVPRYKALVASREGDYFIRGTYTSQNLDFAADVRQIASEGFGNISVEPVVLRHGHRLAIGEEHLDRICAEYEKLTLELSGEDAGYSFFHFNVDLEQGPCIYKRLRGCGAGYEYAAVSPEGDVYPCHQFVGNGHFKMGSVFEGSFDGAISSEFSARSIYSNRECASCWAKYYCSGGCAASNLTVNGSPDILDTVGCALERKRLECAIYLKVLEKARENA